MIRRIGLALLASAIVVVGASPALAEKGGNGRGKGGSAFTVPAWVSASPNPVPAGGSRYEVNGCGFELEPVEVHIVHPAGRVEAWAIGVWNTGCMNPTPFLTDEAGTYRIEVYQQNSRQLTLKASTTLEVE